MTDKNYTHLTLVVDRSGSMQSMAAEASAGIARLLKEQYALPGKFTCTIVEFDDVIETAARISHEVVTYSLRPRGLTALFDAVGREIVKTGADLRNLPDDDRPGHVVFVIVTDGYENASSRFTGDQVKSMVEHQRSQYGWEFQFLGAGESALQGDVMGMPSTRYSNDIGGTQAVYSSATHSLSSLRSGLVDSYQMPEEVEPE